MTTTDDLDALLATFSDSQLRFVQHALYAESKADAARQAGLNPDSIYTWGSDATERINRAIHLARLDAIAVAREKLKRTASVAVDVVLDEMQARRGSSKRLEAAVTSLDRIGFSPRQQIDVNNRITVTKAYTTLGPDEWDSPAQIAADSTTAAPAQPGDVVDAEVVDDSPMWFDASTGQPIQVSSETDETA